MAISRIGLSGPDEKRTKAMAAFRTGLLINALRKPLETNFRQDKNMKSRNSTRGYIPVQSTLVLLAFSFLVLVPVPCANAQEGETIVGRIVAWRSGKVSTQVPGLVRELRVRVGDKVKKGDVLAVFDTSQLLQDVARAEGELAAARAKLKIAIARESLKEKIYTRQKKLKRTSAFRSATYEEAALNLTIEKAGVLAARAQVVIQEANVARKKLDIKLSTVRAPYDGIITRLFTQEGAFVIPEDPHIIELVDDNSLEIEVDIPVRYIHFMKPGQTVDFSLDGKTYKARLRTILANVNPHSQTRAVRFKPLDIRLLKRHAVGQNTDVVIPDAHK